MSRPIPPTPAGTETLPDGVTWTTRLRSNAALYDCRRADREAGRPARAETGSLAGQDRRTAAFSQVTSPLRQDRDHRVHAFTCLWYCVTGAKTVTVVLIRDKSKTGTTSPRHHQQRPGIAAVIEDTPPDGQLKSRSKTRSSSSAPGRPATAPLARSSAPSRSCSPARPSPSPGTHRGHSPATPQPAARTRPGTRRRRAVHRRHDRQAPPRHHRRQI